MASPQTPNLLPNPGLFRSILGTTLVYFDLNPLTISQEAYGIPLAIV